MGYVSFLEGNKVYFEHLFTQITIGSPRKELGGSNLLVTVDRFVFFSRTNGPLKTKSARRTSFSS